MSYSPNPLLSGSVQGPAKIWLVGGIFLATGLLLAILPTLIFPRPNEQTQIAPGQIIDLVYDDEGGAAEVFQFTASNQQSITKRSDIWSQPPSYQIGDQVEIYYDPQDPEQSSWIKDNRGMILAWSILYGLGGFFAIFGLLIILMMLRGMPMPQIERIAGVIGALSFGLPAMLAWPALYWLYQTRPNFIYAANSVLPKEDFLIGAIFSVLGLIVTVATYLIYRAVKNSDSNQISLRRDF